MQKEYNDIEKRRGAWRPVDLLALAIVAVVMRIPYLQERTFFIDESFSWMLGGHAPGEILIGAASESNPPLPIFFFHIWQYWAGAEWELRLLCLLFSVAAVLVIYLLGLHVAGRRAGLLAAALAAISPYQLDYAQIYRYPSLLILLGAAGYYLLWRWSYGKNNRFLYLLAVVFLLGIYTHYFYGFLIIGANIYVFTRHFREKKLLLPWLACQAVVAAGFAPWLFAFMSQASGELAPVNPETLINHLKTFPFLAIPHILASYFFGMLPLEEKAAFAAAGILLYAFLIWRLVKYPGHGLTGFAVINLAVGLALPYLMMLFLGLRLLLTYFCVFSPLFYVAAAAACVGRSWKGNNTSGHAAAIASALLIIISLFSYFPGLSAQEDNKSAIRHIEDNWREGDIVVVNPTYQGSLIDYYAGRELATFGIPRQYNILEYNFQDTTQVTRARLEELPGRLGPDGRVWLFCGFGVTTKPDQDALTYEYLMNNMKLVSEMEFSPAVYAGPIGRLFLFESRSDPQS